MQSSQLSTAKKIFIPKCIWAEHNPVDTEMRIHSFRFPLKMIDDVSLETLFPVPTC